MPFLSDTAPTDRPLRIGYVTDAQTNDEGTPFVETECGRVQALSPDVILIEARTLTRERFDANLRSIDALYVASGSTFALLASLRTTGNDVVVVEHVEAGLPYIVIVCSAGSIITGPDIAPLSLMDDPADGPLLLNTKGLGLIGTTVVPHADGMLPPYPAELIERILRTYCADYALQPLRDDQALPIDDNGERLIPSALGA